MRALLLKWGPRVKAWGWRVWLVLALVLLAVAVVLRILRPRPRGSRGGGPGGRTDLEAGRSKRRMEDLVADARTEIVRLEAEAAARAEVIAEIKAEPDRAERLRRLAELSNRAKEGRP